MLMIALNFKHPMYDLALEVACTLHLKPIELQSLADDFGLQNTRKLAHAIRRLSRRGYPVVLTESLIGRTVQFERPLSDSERLECEHYFEKVCDGCVEDCEEPGGSTEAREGCEDAAAGGAA